MDPVTHCIIGALAGACVAERSELRLAAAVGAVAALAPTIMSYVAPTPSRNRPSAETRGRSDDHEDGVAVA